MPPRLTTAELEVMQVLWEHGELKPGEIQELLERDIKNPALRSILSILVETGLVGFVLYLSMSDSSASCGM